MVLVHQLMLLLLKHPMTNLVLQERNAKFVTEVPVVLVEEIRVVIVGVEEAVVEVVGVVVVIVVAVDKMVEVVSVAGVAVDMDVDVAVDVAVAVDMSANFRVIPLVPAVLP